MLLHLTGLKPPPQGLASLAGIAARLERKKSRPRHQASKTANEGAVNVGARLGALIQ